MIKLNKTLSLFTGLTAIIGVLLVSLIQKLRPIAVQNGMYVCQKAFHFFSLTFPHTVQIFFLFLLSMVLLIIVGKVYVIIVHTLRVKKELRFRVEHHSLLKSIVKKLSLEEKVLLVKNDTPFAFCFGIKNPKIYISTTMMALMEKKEVVAILLHEKYHLENSDSITIVIASLVTSLFPFFPVLSDVLRQYKIQREVNADKKAVMFFGDSQPLISVLKKLLQYPSFAVPVGASIVDEETLEQRIFLLMGKQFRRKQANYTKIIISVLSSIGISSMVLMPMHTVSIQTKTANTTMLCLQTSSCLVGCKEQQTSLPYSIIHIQNESRPYTPFLQN